MHDLVGLLVSKNYRQLVAAGMNGELSEEEIETAVRDYPGEMTLPPRPAFEKFDLYAEQADGSRIVEFELWFDGEVSDLTLSAIVHAGSGSPRIEISDIHVL